MDLHYLTFMRKKLENKKKLVSLWIMNRVDLNDKNIVNSVGIFNDGAIMNSILGE